MRFTLPLKFKNPIPFVFVYQLITVQTFHEQHLKKKDLRL